MYYEELYEKNKRLNLAIRQENYELAAQLLKEIEEIKAQGTRMVSDMNLESCGEEIHSQFTGYMQVQLTEEGAGDFETMVRSHLVDEVKFFPGIKVEDLERIIRMTLWNGILYASHNPQNIRRQFFLR